MLKRQGKKAPKRNKTSKNDVDFSQIGMPHFDLDWDSLLSKSLAREGKGCIHTLQNTIPPTLNRASLPPQRVSSNL
jgi:hypothetical protein